MIGICVYLWEYQWFIIGIYIYVVCMYVYIYVPMYVMYAHVTPMGIEWISIHIYIHITRYMRGVQATTPYQRLTMVNHRYIYIHIRVKSQSGYDVIYLIDKHEPQQIF